MKIVQNSVVTLIVSLAVGGVVPSLFFANPAMAITVVDDSGSRIQPADLDKILSIMTPVGGNIQGLHRAVGAGNERYYCGKVRVGAGFVPFLVNVFSDQQYVSGSSDQDADAKISAFC
jgi:hypothetical protein